ncbi:MAG: GDP-mannose 4,6-dehydratase [Cyclobacteriaceae bacterium]
MAIAIISGISGQDGALLAAFLLNKKYQVIGLVPADRDSDLFRLDYLQVRDKVEIRSIDLLNPVELQNLLEEIKPQEFYNLAAISSVGVSFQIPRLTFDFNTRSVMNLLEAIRQVSPQTRFYHASSSEMFGNVGKDRLPIKESFLFHPVSPYGISKASAHWLTVNYREAYQLRACCGILFNHESALRPHNFVIKKIVRTAVEIAQGAEKTLTLGNIAISRDWGYAPLYVEAMWLMLQQEEMDDYLICSGIPLRLEDFVRKVFDLLGIDNGHYIRIDRSLLRNLDLEIIYGDNSKAKSSLGWSYDLDPDDLVGLLVRDEQELMSWEASKFKAS